MYSGNFGLFKNDITGKHIWLWKIHKTDTTRSMYIDPLTGEETDEKEVFTNGNSKDLRPWRLIYEMSAEEALPYITFAPPDASGFADEQNVFSAGAALSRMRKHKDLLFQEWQQAASYASDAMEKYQESKRLCDVAQERWNKYMFSNDVWMYYVHAKHRADDTVDWTWYAPREIAKTIQPGDTLKVETSRGPQLAIATWVAQSKEFMDHKSVIENVSQKIRDQKLRDKENKE